MYRGFDGKLRLFRPDCNCQRMLTSATRISLPGFDPKELEKLIIALVSVDGPKWLPEPGSFLYLRPTMIGSAGAREYFFLLDVDIVTMSPFQICKYGIY